MDSPAPYFSKAITALQPAKIHYILIFLIDKYQYIVVFFKQTLWETTYCGLFYFSDFTVIYST